VTGGHDHTHATPAEIGRVFGWAIALNAGIVALEAAFCFHHRIARAARGRTAHGGSRIKD